MKTVRDNKIVDLTRLLSLRESYREAGKSVVWTNGFFDLLHRGHVGSLRAASQLGDILVVGLNSDDSCRQLKGDGRPVMPAEDRAEVLAALECVDHVYVFPDLTPAETLRLLHPDVHCKGMDYAPEQGKPMPERDIVESNGGKVVLLPLSPGISTTELIERIRTPSSCVGSRPGEVDGQSG